MQQPRVASTSTRSPRGAGRRRGGLAPCASHNHEYDPLRAGLEGLDRKPEEIVHIFGAGGLTTLGPAIRGGSLYSPPEQPALPTVEEQGLCIGATFGINAVNTVDPSRRVSVLGFCRCIDTLSEHVAGTVLNRGGEVLMREHKVKGVHEKLVMSVMVPFLFGVPAELDTLREAIDMGGGYVDRISKEWRLI